MTELIAPQASRAAALHESAVFAAMLSVAAHAGLILWAVSGFQAREEALSAGGAVSVQVELVQGPEQASGGAAASGGPDRAVNHDGGHDSRHDREPPKGGATPAETRTATDAPSDPATSSARVNPPPSVALHNAADPEAAAPSAIAPPPVPPPAPRPLTSAADPAPSHDAPAIESPHVSASFSESRGVVAAIDAARGAADGGSTAPDATEGSGEMQGAAPSADNPAPPYPAAARLRGQYGRVVLRVEVSPSGDAESVQVAESSGYDVLDRAAADTVKRWRFIPARRNGSAVAAMVHVPVRFALQ
jgi:protein TonB